jgi:hypothetical protein
MPVWFVNASKMFADGVKESYASNVSVTGAALVGVAAGTGLAAIVALIVAAEFAHPAASASIVPTPKHHNR